MAGFTFNGFGAADSYYQIWQIGEHYCKCCGGMKPFSVMELRMKIRVLFVPTVTVNTKYAVACNKCQNGYYIDEIQKNDIMMGRVTVEVKSDGVVLERVEDEEKNVENPFENMEHGKMQPDNIVEKTKNNQEVYADDEVKNIGKENAADNQEITYDKKEEQETVAVLPIIRKIKQCPKCKLMYNMSKELCTICNSKLEEKE